MNSVWSIVILQNAWYEKLKKKPYDKWLIALWKSHTGRRLIEMLPEGIPYFIINSTDEITDNPNDALEANYRWIRKWMRLVKPKIVLACGKVAQKACYELKIKHIIAPHPAWRGLMKLKTAQIKALIIDGYDKSS